MARVLDLNNVQQYFMDLTLQDAARTVVRLDIPQEALVSELQSMGPELEKVKNGDQNSVNIIYDLAARLISCNLDYFRVTGQELREKYGMNLYSAIAFFSAYMAFISELANQKN